MFRSVVLLAAASFTAGAQSLSDVPTKLDIAAGAWSGITSLSAMASRATYAGTTDRLTVGLGLRVTMQATNGLGLAPRDPRGLGPYRDTLTVKGNALMLNFGVNLGVDITTKLQAGMNLDLFGFGTGSSHNASYRPTPGSSAQSLSAKPASSNIFAGGSGDRGSLNSEFFLAWTLNERYSLRGGLSHQLVEYRVNAEPIVSNTDQFRRFVNLAFIGLRVTRPQ